jgi:hypothetical protein
MVFVGARRSSPGIAEDRYDCVLFCEREEPPVDCPMDPVNGVRSVVLGPRGSSRSSRSAEDNC